MLIEDIEKNILLCIDILFGDTIISDRKLIDFDFWLINVRSLHSFLLREIKNE